MSVMVEGAFAVTALGMVTALGRDAVTSCAAARAGLVQTSELKGLDIRGDELFGRETLEGGPVVFGHTVRGVAEGFAGLAKMLLLGEVALDGLLAQRRLSPRERSRTGFVVNLSDHFVIDADAQSPGAASLPSARWREQTARLHLRLAASRELLSPSAHPIVHYGGQAGVAAAMEDAMAMITKGHVDRCIVGGIDARTEPAFLKAAARLNLLRTIDNAVGLIPGEAAAFFLLERQKDALAAGFPPAATVLASAVGRDPADLLSSEHPSLGIGLAQSIRAALSPGIQVGFSIGDHNGTSRRAMEWANAMMRLRDEYPLHDLPTWYPAVSFGDTGAAAGAVGVCVATRAFARGYAPADVAIVWLSSESGAKGAIALRAA